MVTSRQHGGRCTSDAVTSGTDALYILCSEESMTIPIFAVDLLVQSITLSIAVKHCTDGWHRPAGWVTPLPCKMKSRAGSTLWDADWREKSSPPHLADYFFSYGLCNCRPC